MLQTYKALLRGNRLEWSGDAPDHLEEEQTVEVYVTILKEATASSVGAQGKKMAEALEKLAAIDALSEIDDPSAWQREQRQERALPDRDA
jgi:hypothetical protein